MNGQNIKKRDIGISILLTVVTCGIYGLFWIYNLINDICDLKDVARTGGRDIILSILTCGIYSWFVFYRMGADIDELRYRRGYNKGSNNIVYLIFAILGLGIVPIALAQHSVNELC